MEDKSRSEPGRIELLVSIPFETKLAWCIGITPKQLGHKLTNVNPSAPLEDAQRIFFFLVWNTHARSNWSFSMPIFIWIAASSAWSALRWSSISSSENPVQQMFISAKLQTDSVHAWKRSMNPCWLCVKKAIDVPHTLSGPPLVPLSLAPQEQSNDENEEEEDEEYSVEPSSSRQRDFSGC